MGIILRRWRSTSRSMESMARLQASVLAVLGGVGDVLESLRWLPRRKNRGLSFRACAGPVRRSWRRIGGRSRLSWAASQPLRARARARHSPFRKQRKPRQDGRSTFFLLLLPFHLAPLIWPSAAAAIRPMPDLPVAFTPGSAQHPRWQCNG